VALKMYWAVLTRPFNSTVGRSKQSPLSAGQKPHKVVVSAW